MAQGTGGSTAGGSAAEAAQEHTLRERLGEFVFRLAESKWSPVLPAALFLALTVLAFLFPASFLGKLIIDIDLKSEAAIPVEPKKPIDDIVGRFRHMATGTEFRAGIPYWIFRVMPRIEPEQFGGRGYDWFGFDEEHDDYFDNPLPRGLALSDTDLRAPLLQAQFKLKRVSINCSGCHRGEYLEGGKLKFVDGMPNHTANLQAFKRFFAHAFQDPRFDGNRVVAEIDGLLAELHKEPLDAKEQLVYRALVAELKQGNGASSAWMDRRADNGPGRIDPFNAVKFEVLKVPDDGTAPTLDFPSIWNQRAFEQPGEPVRTWHHYDGNTQSSDARNFGSVIGVGGISLSVDKGSIRKIGAWLEDLKPPIYPFENVSANAPDVLAGKKLFIETYQCASCHGVYDRATNRVDASHSPHYMKLMDVNTDPERWKAFPPAAAAALNQYGYARALWERDAFRGDSGPGYLCGPLDGIWARAPYLHNGSVPNLAELLKHPQDRVTSFYRGNPAYDSKNVGWVSDEPTRPDTKIPLFSYETMEKGNSNEGHDFAVQSDDDVKKLLAYLKSM